VRKVWTYFGRRTSRPNTQPFPTLIVDTNMFVGALLKEQTELQEELADARAWQSLLDASLSGSRVVDGATRFQVPASIASQKIISIKDWVEFYWQLEVVSDEIKDHIAGLERQLTALGRRIQAFFSRFSTHGCLRDLIVVQIGWFALHGDHPPHLSDSVRIPIQRPGACLA